MRRSVLSYKVCMAALLTAVLLFGCKNKPEQAADAFTSADYSVLSLWTGAVRTVIKQSTGCSAPVAARALSYFYIAQYETLYPGMQNHVSLHGKINGYARTWNDREEDIPLFHWSTVINSTAHTMLLDLFPTIPSATLNWVENLYDSLKINLSQNISENRIVFSEEYAGTITANVMAYASTDGGADGHFTNFPTSYTPPNCASCWIFTPPFFQRALQPYWGSNRLFVPSSSPVLSGFAPLEYSEVPGSAFYEDAHLIYTMLQNPEPQNEVIAEFWDDGTGYAGTPPGHYLALADQLIRNRYVPTEEAIVFLTRLSIVMNDAMVLTWKGKYDHNLLRPVTYIHRVISQQFNPIIETPPFPEFPSGHAVMAGATRLIYESFFSNSLSFHDSTHVSRTDINGSPRYYPNFEVMSMEISDSRWVAGIHYKYTQDQSLILGRQIAMNIYQSVNLSK